MKKELDVIKSSKGFKVTRFLGSKIDKIKQTKNLPKDIEATFLASKKTIEIEGMSSFAAHAKQKIKQGEFLLNSNKFENIPTQLSTVNEFSKVSTVEVLPEEQTYEQKFNASVVIPTNSNETSLRKLIENINSQKGFKNLQILLINSGKAELSSLEKFSNVRCITINPEDFGHGKTRKIGFNESKGDFVIYLTDDAIPASKHLFYDLCNVFSKDKKIAAATARQIPRSDSDLMSLFSINEYYEHLKLDHDRITFTTNFNKLDSAEKRRTSQIDDVCACYKREIISKYQFGEVQYAEDLDMGIRLVRDGYKIAQLFSTGVIHSHIRPASYYVRRQYVDTKILSSLLDYHIFDFKKYGIMDIKTVFDQILSLYKSLNQTIDLLKQNNTIKTDETFQILKNELPKMNSTSSHPKSFDSSLNSIFEDFSHDHKTVKNSYLLQDLLASLQIFQNFLNKSYPNLSGLQNDFYATIYKLFGVIIGNRLGGFVLFAKNNSLKDNNLEKLEMALERDV